MVVPCTYCPLFHFHLVLLSPHSQTILYKLMDNIDLPVTYKDIMNCMFRRENCMSDLNYLTFCHVIQILIEATGMICKAHYTHNVREVIFASYVTRNFQYNNYSNFSLIHIFECNISSFSQENFHNLTDITLYCSG